MRTLTCVMSALLCLCLPSCGDKEEPAKTSQNQPKPKKRPANRTSINQDASVQEALVLETKVTMRGKGQ